MEQPETALFVSAQLTLPERSPVSFLLCDGGKQRTVLSFPYPDRPLSSHSSLSMA